MTDIEHRIVLSKRTGKYSIQCRPTLLDIPIFFWITLREDLPSEEVAYNVLWKLLKFRSQFKRKY